MSISRLMPIASSFVRSGALRQATQTLGKQSGAFIQDFANTAATHHIVGPHVQNAASAAMKQSSDYIGTMQKSLQNYSFDGGRLSQI